MLYKINKETLTDQEIISIIDDFRAGDRKRYYNNEKYYYGENQYVLNEKKAVVDEGAPDWRLCVSYGRKLIKTVAGYMFKTGTTKYVIKDKKFKKEIDRIFTVNKEPLKTSQTGRKSSTYGTVYELHYIEKNSPETPRWAIVSPLEIIPIYNYDIDPKLVCFIRFYDIQESYDPKGDDPSYMKVEVYYSTHTEYYKRVTEINQKTKEITSKLIKIDENINLYKVPPLVIYKNNDELLGDVEPVKKLIDAYDVLMSDGLNEWDRFAWAYLLLVGERLDPEDAKNIKVKRIFENLESKDAVSFLTKDINNEFLKYMAQWIRSEIHEQSHIPDFTAQQGGDRLSGVALDRLIFDFQLLCSEKEEYFKQGLYDRFKMIDQIVNITNTDHELITNDIKIIMDRNRPTDMLQNAQVFGTLDGRGVSRKTLIENLVPFVTDADKELKLFEEQQKKAKDQMSLDFETAIESNNDLNVMQTKDEDSKSQEPDNIID